MLQSAKVWIMSVVFVINFTFVKNIVSVASIVNPRTSCTATGVTGDRIPAPAQYIFFSIKITQVLTKTSFK